MDHQEGEANLVEEEMLVEAQGREVVDLIEVQEALPKVQEVVEETVEMDQITKDLTG